MARINLFETRRIPEAERLRGLSVDMVNPLVRVGRWRHELPHVEPQAVVVWVARGQARLTVEGTACVLGPATLGVVPSGVPFAVQPGTVMQGTLLRVPDLPEAPLPNRPVRLRLSDVGTQAELAALLDGIARAHDLRVPAVGRATLGRVILLSALVEREARRAAAVPPPGAHTDRTSRFAYAVEAALPSGAPLDVVLRRAGEADEAAFGRAMAEACGMGANAYREARVMYAARRRLADTQEGEQGIAHDLGFASAGHFADAFQRHAGTTPDAFRASERRFACADRG